MDVVVPKVGLTVETLDVIAWRKSEGDEVVAGETLCELAADKADLEVEAPESGVLTEIRAGDGATVAPGEVLAVIGAPGEPPGASVGDAPVEQPGRPEPAPVADSAVSGANGAVATSERLRVSPVARRAADRHGLDLAALNGSGPRGRIVLRDVEAAAKATPAADPGAVPPPAVPRRDAAPVRFSAARRATARAMAESHAKVAPVTLHRRAGADAALAAVKRLKADGLPATFTHAVLAACARALLAHPAVNSVWDGETLLRAPAADVGVAVDDDGDLLLGVVPDAASLDTIGLVLGAVEAVARARAREPIATRPSFTISNLGMFGVEQFTPIVSLPAIAVLGVGAVVDGRCHLSLTFDHRAVDGAPAARFLAEVAAHLQSFDGR